MKKRKRSKAARRAELEAIETKWLSASDLKRVRSGEKPIHTSFNSETFGKGWISIVTGGRVSPK